MKITSFKFIPFALSLFLFGSLLSAKYSFAEGSRSNDWVQFLIDRKEDSKSKLPKKKKHKKEPPSSAPAYSGPESTPGGHVAPSPTIINRVPIESRWNPEDVSQNKAVSIFNDYSFRVHQAIHKAYNPNNSSNTVSSGFNIAGAMLALANCTTDEGAKALLLRHLTGDESNSNLSADDVNSLLQGLAVQYNSLSKKLREATASDSESKIAIDAAFMTKDIDLDATLEQCRDFMVKEFGAEFKQVESGKDINDWVKQKTEGLIEKVVDDEERFDQALVTTFYSSLPWKYKFPKPETPEKQEMGVFNGEKIPFMTIKHEPVLNEDGSEQLDEGGNPVFKPIHLPYYRDDKFYSFNEETKKASNPYMAARIPLVTGGKERFGWDVVVPLDESLTPSLFSLNEKQKQDLFRQRKDRVVTKLSMPKAKYEMTSSVDVLKVAESMGDKLEGIPVGSSQVSSIKHKASTVADEERSQTAAVTVVAMSRSLGAPPPSVVLDRPFIMDLTDSETGLVLARHSVAKPTPNQ